MSTTDPVRMTWPLKRNSKPRTGPHELIFLNFQLLLLVVDTWLVFNAVRTFDDASYNWDQKTFHTNLAHELIDNKYEARVRSPRRSRLNEEAATLATIAEPTARAGVMAHLMRSESGCLRIEKGVQAKKRVQARCKICSKKTTYVCSDCPEIYLYYVKNRADEEKMCFKSHIEAYHLNQE